jgi:heavy metal sensor kinase
MTLTTRLSLFFLAALAVVLLGFSATLYVLARVYLYKQTEDRLDAALNALVAAAEITPEGVEWEPHERVVSLGPDGASDRVEWTVRDDQGRPLPGSPNPTDADFLKQADSPLVSGDSVRATIYHCGQTWYLRQRRLKPDDSRQTLVHGQPAPSDPDPQAVRYPMLVLTAAVSLEPAQARLRTLALVLSTLACGLWLVAALVGRSLCHRALAPVARMAETAHGISAATLDLRLPPAGTADELDALGREFNALLSRLEESFERQRRFTGDASHQLRTPLAAMLGQVEVALRRDRTSEEYRLTLERVREQASGMRQIVEMLLFLARADAESHPPELETLSLSAWLHDYLSRWSEHARWSDLQIKCPADNACRVSSHAALLTQLMDNLVDNACKHTPPTTPITLQLEHEAGVIALSVEDAGPGIPPEELPHILEPFYRSAQARRRGVGGVGLGLAIASRVAAALQGTLSVDSRIGHGSRFTLRLQAQRDELENPPVISRRQPEETGIVRAEE